MLPTYHEFPNPSPAVRLNFSSRVDLLLFVTFPPPPPSLPGTSPQISFVLKNQTLKPGGAGMSLAPRIQNYLDWDGFKIISFQALGTFFLGDFSPKFIFPKFIFPILPAVFFLFLQHSQAAAPSDTIPNSPKFLIYF